MPGQLHSRWERGERDSLRLSGLLVSGEELAGRPAVLFRDRDFWAHGLNFGVVVVF